MLMYAAWGTQLLSLLAVVVLSIERAGRVSPGSERHLASCVSAVGVSAALSIAASLSTGLYYASRGGRGDVESLPAEPDAGSTSSRYTLLLVGLAHVALQTAAVCFAVASEMLLQTQAACGAGGAGGEGGEGGEGGSFEVTTALTVVALVAHLVTVVVGHVYAFEKK